MQALSLPLFSVRTLITDAVLLTAIYFVPALSHVVSFPVHLFEPMRVLLIAGLLISRNSLNTYFLALTIPLVSTFIAGHPPLPKALVMSFELYVNMVLLIGLTQRFISHQKEGLIFWTSTLLTFFLSTVLSKVAYYALKFLFLQFGWIQGSLISTPLVNQLIVVAILAIVYALVLSLVRGFQSGNGNDPHRLGY